MDCFYCKRDSRLYDLTLPLKELAWSNVYLFRDQKHRGRVVVALKEHKNEIWQLTDAQRDGFFKEVSQVAEAVCAVAHADKINYAIYGDIVSHFHVHLVPKRRGELEWGGPFTDKIEKVLLTDAEYAELSAALIEKLSI